jgi:hypothetical protein
MRRVVIVLPILFFLLILLSGCGPAEEEQKFNGDLYFKLVNVGSTYGQDSISARKINLTLDSLLKVDKKQLSKVDLDFLEIYGGLKEHSILDKPSFGLRVNSMNNYAVYTSPAEFDKVKNFSMDDLLKDGKKVEIELTGTVVRIGNLSLIKCTSIDQVKMTDGTTYWDK